VVVARRTPDAVAVPAAASQQVTWARMAALVEFSAKRLVAAVLMGQVVLLVLLVLRASQVQLRMVLVVAVEVAADRPQPVTTAAPVAPVE
jgi:hypothetical protein